MLIIAAQWTEHLAVGMMTERPPARHTGPDADSGGRGPGEDRLGTKCVENIRLIAYSTLDASQKYRKISPLDSTHHTSVDAGDR